MVIVGRIATAFGGGRNAGEGQFLWPRRPPIIGHYQTLQTMVIVGRIALPLGTWTKAVGAGGTDWHRPRDASSYSLLIEPCRPWLSWVGLHCLWGVDGRLSVRVLDRFGPYGPALAP